MEEILQKFSRFRYPQVYSQIYRDFNNLKIISRSYKQKRGALILLKKRVGVKNPRAPSIGGLKIYYLVMIMMC